MLDAFTIRCTGVTTSILKKNFIHFQDSLQKQEEPKQINVIFGNQKT